MNTPWETAEQARIAARRKRCVRMLYLISVSALLYVTVVLVGRKDKGGSRKGDSRGCDTVNLGYIDEANNITATNAIFSVVGSLTDSATNAAWHRSITPDEKKDKNE